jgi:nucleotide-binding universal stress UspA family protein
MRRDILPHETGREGGETMKILVGYDGSDGARRALELAATLARHDDQVSVVAVAEGIPLFGHASTLPSPEQEDARQGQLLEAERVLGAHGLASSLVRRSGDPATAILELADEQDVDLVVLGTRGVSTVERWLIGSVSSKVLQHAACSVLVAR